MIKEMTGFTGELDYDDDKPDGTPLKMMDSSTLNNLGWHPKTSLQSGVANTYQ